MMEMLGGFAIALAMIYGGYRIIETGATPGAFVSFIAAFLLAYEPAKRLARLNIDLNNNLVGVRVLYEVVDSPPGEPSDDDRPPLKLDSRAPRIRRRAFRLSARHPGAARHELRRAAGQGHRAGRPVGRRQIDRAQSDAALLRRQFRPHPDRRPGHRRRVAPLAAAADRLCRADRAPVPRHHPREHRASAGSAPAKPRSSPPPRPRMRTSSSWASRPATIRRSASTACSCPAANASASPLPARWSRISPVILLDEATASLDFGIRAPRPGGDRRTVQGAHDAGHRPPPVHHHARRLHSGGRKRRRGRVPAATTSYCARAAVTRRSTGCSCASRPRPRRISAARRSSPLSPRPLKPPSQPGLTAPARQL